MDVYLQLFPFHRVQNQTSVVTTQSDMQVAKPFNVQTIRYNR